MVLRRDAPDFLQRSDSLERLVDSHHAERSHPFADRLVFHDRGRCALDDEPANRFAHRQRFDDRHPAKIAAPLAPIATAPVIKDRALRRCH